jgi:hypothetical protein
MTNQPKFGEWIKCSDRLPDQHWEYLVFPRHHHLTATFFPHDDFQEKATTIVLKKNSWYRTDENGFDYVVEPISLDALTRGPEMK